MKILSEPMHIPFGPYVAKMMPDPDFCKRLLELGRTLANKQDEYLAGAIKHQYGYDLKKHSWLGEEFKVCVNTWISGYRHFAGDAGFNPKFKLNLLWINFQKSMEYNPIHTHPNCTLSFILFLEVPKEMLEEKQATRGIPSGFTGFLYGEDYPGIITNRIVKPEEGALLMFPSNIRHYVSHFKSKVTRTTVSGNITFS